jgi:uncharacterized protein YggE
MNDSAESMWQSKKLTKALFWLAVVGIIFIGAKSLNELKQSSYIGRDISAQNTITVSGEGEAFAKPDTATFSFTIEEQAKVVADAEKATDKKVNAALDFLKKNGIDEKDIKTTSYQIYPNYKYNYPTICPQYGCPPQGEPTIDGYKVSETIEVKVRDLAKAGDLLSGIGAVGVMNLSGLNFTIDKEDQLQAQARSQAIDKAKAKALELAKELGVSIVRVTNFSESGSYPPIYYNQIGLKSADSGVGGATPSAAVPPGETRIVSNVSITYEIR